VVGRFTQTTSGNYPNVKTETKITTTLSPRERVNRIFRFFRIYVKSDTIEVDER